MIDIARAPINASKYFNRELSWLAFNARVLSEAEDNRVPLLERLKFLAIFSSNLDEFYMVRVAGLRRQVLAGVTQAPPDGLSPAEQLAAIRLQVSELMVRQRACLTELLSQLSAYDIGIVGVPDLSPREWSEIDAYFESQVFPVLTPLAVDPGHPFPYISNLSVSLAVVLRDPEKGNEHFARVKVPKSLSRWVAVPGRQHTFVPLEDVIGANLGALFPGMEIVSWHPFRITRFSDLEMPVDEPEDLLATIEEQVFRRRFGEVVRVEVEDEMPDNIRQLLLDELRDEDISAPGGLVEADFHDAGDFLDLADLAILAAIDVPALRDPPFAPVIPPRLAAENQSIFDVIRERDVLVHHPFDSFSASVERFLSEAAVDPDVLAVKITLYRTSGDLAIASTLIEAAQRGKQVAVLVELKARFDEANNIAWARRLEDAGIHVAYGSATLKTHVKTALVVRREADGIRRYVHLGTGNYNSRTARLYTDLGLFTANQSMGADASDLFNSLTGYSRQHFYRKLLVAPVDLRHRVVSLIRREAELASRGRPGRIMAKMNALVDADVIDELYAASAAGVEIDLITRGICCLRPGVPGLSDGIRVTSIIGRFLEHSRLWYFGNDGEPEYYIGSADWMPRNFDRRVEAMAPVESDELRQRLSTLLQTYLQDERQGWQLSADGTWRQRQGVRRDSASHEILLRNSWGQLSVSSIDADEKTSRSGPTISTGTPQTLASSSDL
jgi:polyphosphate kinase